jgi:DNA-binding HxlR family transcriptional regulator
MQLHKTVIPHAERQRSACVYGMEIVMVKRTRLEDHECPIARSLDAIGDWWSMLIVRDSMLGRRRFGEFQKSLGLAKNILATRLRMLVDQGILKLAPASDGSAYQEYVLTDKGRGIFPVLVALRQWSEEFDDHPEDIATILVDRKNGRPVRKLELRSQDGRLLEAADTTLKPQPAAKRRRTGG